MINIVPEWNKSIKVDKVIFWQVIPYTSIFIPTLPSLKRFRTMVIKPTLFSHSISDG